MLRKEGREIGIQDFWSLGFGRRDSIYPGFCLKRWKLLRGFEYHYQLLSCLSEAEDHRFVSKIESVECYYWRVLSGCECSYTSFSAHDTGLLRGVDDTRRVSRENFEFQCTLSDTVRADSPRLYNIFPRAHLSDYCSWALVLLVEYFWPVIFLAKSYDFRCGGTSLPQGTISVIWGSFRSVINDLTPYSCYNNQASPIFTKIAQSS